MSKFCSNTRLFADRVRKFISDFPDLKYDGSQVICLVCNRSLLAFKRSQCINHINSAAHKAKKSGNQRYTEFIFDFIFMLCACNIPLFLLTKQPFRHFWNKYNPTWKLPSRSTLQRYLPSVREKVENNIKLQTRNQKLWLTVDETTDSKKHSVANVVVRTLDPLRPSPPYLLASKRLETCSREAIERLILTTLHKFELKTNQVLIFVSDGAAVMRATGRFLKHMCPNVIHVTCILHAMHLTAEMVRKCYPDVDALIAHTKAVFLKSPKRIKKFKRECPGISEPPQPVLTRWGTWLEAAFYYARHFEKIKSLVLQFDAKDSVAIRDSQIKFQDAQVEADLNTIHSNYSGLMVGIDKLQDTSLSLAEALQIVDEVKQGLQTLSDEKGIRVHEKFGSVLKKNLDFARLRLIYSNSAEADPLNVFRNYFNYANITSLDVERSFSLYKNIYASQRTSLTETTVETYIMLQMYSRAHPDV